MVLFFRQNPFVRVFLFLTLGIWSGNWIPCSWVILGLISGGLLTLFVLYSFGLFRNSNMQYRDRWKGGVILFTFFFLAGYVLPVLQQPSSLQVTGVCRFEAYVSEVIGYSNDYVKARMVVRSLTKNDSVYHGPYSLLGWMKKDVLSDTSLNGVVVQCRGMVSKGEPAIVPYQFDEQRFLFCNGYSGKCVVNQVEFVGKPISHPLFQNSMSQIRGYFKTQFSQVLTNGDECSVVQSLVLGDRSELSRDIKSDFVRSGVIHVLAVSGLHVGILYWIFGFVFFFLKRGVWRWIRFVAIILLLWFYAWLTGFSPSVTRATVMFSVLLTGKEFQLQSSMYNSLSVSGVIILFFDSFSFFDIGFWLSHLAVLGIFTFYQLIYKMIAFQFIVWRWLWAMISVSLSAQITTFPLSLYFFHSFPSYFLLANVLILPVIPFVLGLSVVLLFIPSGSLFSDVIASVLSDLVGYTNTVASGVAAFPYSYPDDFSITMWEVILLFISIFTLHHYWVHHKTRSLAAGLVAFFLVLLSFNVRYWAASDRQCIEMVSWHGKTIVNLVDGKQNLVLMSENVKENDVLHFFSNSWTRFFVSEPQFVQLRSTYKHPLQVHWGDHNFTVQGDQCVIYQRNGSENSLVIVSDSSYLRDRVSDYSGVDSLFLISHERDLFRCIERNKSVSPAMHVIVLGKSKNYYCHSISY